MKTPVFGPLGAALGSLEGLEDDGPVGAGRFNGLVEYLQKKSQLSDHLSTSVRPD